MDNDFLIQVNDLSKEYNKLAWKYTELIEVILDIHRCYPHIVKEIVTEERLEYILGKEE